MTGTEPRQVHAAIEKFIGAAPSWGPEAAELAAFEWEAENILQLFSGLKQKKTTLPEETINFFEFDLPGRLSDADVE